MIKRIQQPFQTVLLHPKDNKKENFAKSLAVYRTNNWWIFRKILWPSQTI